MASSGFERSFSQARGKMQRERFPASNRDPIERMRLRLADLSARIAEQKERRRNRDGLAEWA